MPTPKRTTLLLSSLFVLVGGGSLAADPKPAVTASGTASKPRLRKPEYLPEEGRALLHARMARHGDDMMLLMATVLMLNHEVAEDLALNLAKEPRFVRPGPNTRDTLNESLPPRFFELQDELAERASAVARAAKARNDASMVKAYGRLAETCVACHSTYFRGAPLEARER